MARCKLSISFFCTVGFFVAACTHQRAHMDASRAVAGAKAVTNCEMSVADTSRAMTGRRGDQEQQELQKRVARALERDQAGQREVERRVKVLTRGLDDTADPSIPHELRLPDGRTVWAVYYSGGRVVYYESMVDLLRGGVRDFETVEVRTAEGHPLRMTPYHTGEAIWDGEPVLVGAMQIGHGGMMVRPDPAKPARVDRDNYTRSRHAFSIEISLDAVTGKIRQVWRDLGAIHGNRPGRDGRWLVKEKGRWHAHGYGSRLIRNADGQPFRDNQGHMWIVYEQVTREKVLPNGRRLPYATEIFARRMNEDLTRGIGDPVLLSSYASWKNPTRPFAAAKRKGPKGELAGYLVEGPNPILLRVQGKEYWVILFSAGDFVAEYGNYMMFREKSEGPIGPYRHLTDANGELINLTAGVEKKFDLTWSGRLNAFYGPDGKLWGLAHGIFKSDIPDGWVKNGWPRTAKEFVRYARRGLLIPLQAELENGRPVVSVAGE